MREKLRARWKESKLRAWTEGKIHLSRGKKLALNLVLIAVAGLWLWGLAGYPLPTAELEFRRLERTNLEERSELVFLSRGEGQRFQVDENTWVCLDRPGAVGVLEERALVGVATRVRVPVRMDSLRRYPLEEGANLVPLTGCTLRQQTYGAGGSRVFDGHALLLINLPQEAVEGTLALEGSLQGEVIIRDCPLFPIEAGVWIALVEQPENGAPSDWFEGADYALQLYDGSGDLLLKQEGTIPEPL